MFTVTVKPGRGTVPPLCVACGAPAQQPTNAAGSQAVRLDASGSTRYGNKVFTEKVSFLLCQECADARTRSAKGERYAGDWLPMWLGVVGMAFLVAFFVRVVLYERGDEWSGLTFMFFAVFFAGVVSAVLLDWLLRRRGRRNSPPNEEERRRLEDDSRRLGLIGQAVRISPQVGPGGAGGEVVGVDLTLRDETFARAFATANPRSVSEALWSTDA